MAATAPDALREAMYMSTIVVAGVASLGVAVPVERFPLGYQPQREPSWMRVGVSGVAAHVARVLSRLGDTTRLCTVVGDDPAGTVIRAELERENLDGPTVVTAAGSSLSVSLIASDGMRLGMPYTAAVDAVTYPSERFVAVARDADLAVMTNARIARSLLPYAVALGVPIATDVHLISDLDDTYDRPWLEVADVLFCSHEHLPVPPRVWVGDVLTRYPGAAIVGVGCGARGALMGLRDGRLVSVSAVAPRGVRNTLGAGDALMASFLHVWLATGNPVEALQDAVVYAGWQVGSQYQTDDVLDNAGLLKLRERAELRVSLDRWDRPQTLRGRAA